MKQLWITVNNKKKRIDSIALLREAFNSNPSTEMINELYNSYYDAGILIDWIKHQAEYTNNIKNEDLNTLLHAITKIEHCSIDTLKDCIENKKNDNSSNTEEEVAVLTDLETILNGKESKDTLVQILLTGLVMNTPTTRCLLFSKLIKQASHENTPSAESNNENTTSIPTTQEKIILENLAKAKQERKKQSERQSEKIGRMSADAQNLNITPSQMKFVATTPSELEYIIKNELPKNPDQTVTLVGNKQNKRTGFIIRCDEITTPTKFVGIDDPILFVYTKGQNIQHLTFTNITTHEITN